LVDWGIGRKEGRVTERSRYKKTYIAQTGLEVFLMRENQGARAGKKKGEGGEKITIPIWGQERKAENGRVSGWEGNCSQVWGDSTKKKKGEQKKGEKPRHGGGGAEGK